jgi:alanyl-tRNA synthetase
VLRRIARRAIRHGYKLGARKPFFHRLVAAVVAEMGDAYPDLRAQQARVTAVLKQEEEQFFRTIANGMEILETALCRAEAGQALSGDVAFKLHDTFGFPVDLTADVCRERGVAVDVERFEALLGEQRERARASAKFRMAQGLEYSGGASTFHGYETLVHEAARITAIYVDGAAVETANAGDVAVVVLDHTPF